MIQNKSSVQERDIGNFSENLNGKLCTNDCKVLDVALFDGKRETAHIRPLLCMNKEVNK